MTVYAPVAGWSLPREYYVSEDIFRRDVELLGTTQWLMVDHESRIRSPGEWFRFEFGNESVLIVRDRCHRVNAFYNVCRHRGSRLCLEAGGTSRQLRCPYHSWTYELDGSLRTPQYMPTDFDPSRSGLLPCHARVFQGMIFLNLSETQPPDFDSFTAETLRFLVQHRLDRSKIAHRRTYPVRGNWKLVVENFFECYHCRTAHRTYVSVHDGLKLLAFGAGAGSSDGTIGARFAETLRAWEDATRAKGHVTGMFGDSETSAFFRSASRLPIREGFQTETIDGSPAAPLMGELADFDGGQTAVTFSPISTVLVNNDYAVMFRFTPRGPLETDIEAIWLVDDRAESGVDYDEARLTAVWDITTLEDTALIENNQLGILSAAYRPGRYSAQEQRIADFDGWYLRRLRDL